MGLPFWLTRSDGIDGTLYPKNAWDATFLGPYRLPGICRVKCAPKIEFDRQKVNGRDGAAIILRGYLPGPIEIECKIWTAEQWTTFQEIAPKIWKKPGKVAIKGKDKSAAAAVAGAAATEQAALDISHPATLLWGVRSVVVTGVSAPEDGPEVGTKIIRIQCIEFVATSKKPATRNTKGSKGTEIVDDSRFAPANDPRHKKPSETDAGPHEAA